MTNIARLIISQENYKFSLQLEVNLLVLQMNIYCFAS